jgi:hypothetical protein
MDVPRPVKSWMTANRLEAIGWTAVVVAWLLQGYAGVFRRDNDFLWHVDRGKEFLAGHPSDNYRQWYPLARYAWDAGLTFVPYRIARGISLVVATAAFIATVVLWRRMLESRWPISAVKARWAMLIAIAFASPYIRRDLDDCGIHLLLLVFATAAVYACFTKRGMSAGFFGALAVCYKPTALFLWPFLLWKRQWKAAMTLPVAVVALNLAPALYLGWDETIRYHRATADVYRRAAENRDYLTNVMEEPRHENQSLPFAIARFLQTVPPEHTLFLKHPVYVQFGRLPTEQANLVVKGVLLAIAGWFAWRTRTVFTRPTDRTAFAAEAAGAFVLVALVSPLCWKQHLVMLLPAIFVRVWAAFARGTTIADKFLAGGLIASAILLPKDLIGRELAAVAASYKLDTLLGLFLFALVIAAAKVPAGMKQPLHVVEPKRAAA